MVLRISLYVITAMLLGAHFLRGGDLIMLALCLAMPLLFIYKKRLSLTILKFGAFGATFVWLLTAYQLVQVREATGQPWMVAVIILFSVGLFSLVAGLLLNSQCMRKRYPH